MRPFTVSELPLSPEEHARLAALMVHTNVRWVDNLAVDPLGAMKIAGMDGKPLILADRHTLRAFGGRWGEHKPLEIPHTADATQTLVDHIRTNLKGCDYILALGSGTINDLAKYASFLHKIPYAVIPTAPTMNGYLSANASIVVGGHKKTLPAHMPKAVLCDLMMLCKVPERFIAAGFGDAICRFTAQTDWYMSHLLMETPYDPLPFKLLEENEKQLITSIEPLKRRVPQAVQLLMENLLLSGLGMGVAGSSAPASQGEHLIAHTMGMVPSVGLAPQHRPLHGEHISICTLYMAFLQRSWLDTPAEEWLKGQWKSRARDRKWQSLKQIEGFFGPTGAGNMNEEFLSKLLNDRGFEQFLERFASTWDGMRARIQSKVFRHSAREVYQWMTELGAMTDPGQAGWRKVQFEAAAKHAHFIRNRFTFLDLVYLFSPQT